MSEQGWKYLEELFAQACDLPASTREQFAAQRCAGNPVLLRELLALLRAHAAATGFLETPPQVDHDATAESPALATDSRLGAWRVVRPLGRGGMGEVYEVLRADGAFDQRAALKLLRREAVAQIERFHAERNILARFDHPGIARLLDGGVAEDGRPWAVLEYVEGRTITAWCAAHGADLTVRLRLFAQVCDAVTYAHRNLIVHRDLKPSNILVDATGRVRLLDFGIAKLIDPASGAASEITQMPLTPDYCAPEQLTGEAVTTATDVYALGILLYELLTGTKPWSIQGMPLARAVRMLTEASVPKPSSKTAANPGTPVPARLLRGDLDAIVARCLRKEPEYRYTTVDAIKLDVERCLRGDPVAARDGARLYVFGRFMRRYRWGVAGIAALILALAAGLGGVTWQARRAQTQAVRAEATKNFLIDMFKASDTSRASDKPRGGITARELLDASSARVERGFADQPELQIELLGITADIYEALEEPERYASQHRKYTELARRHYGELHPLVIDGYIQDATYASNHEDSINARRLLDEVDPLIRQAGLDETPARARWWVIKVNLLSPSPTRQAETRELLTRAIDLYERTDTREEDYVNALVSLGNVYVNSGEDPARARAFFLRAKAALAQLPENDRKAAFIEISLAHAAGASGDLAEAAASDERAAKLYLQTVGEQSIRYWQALTYWAIAACDGGERERAHRLFDRLLALLPAKPDVVLQSRNVSVAEEGYGYCLVEEGRPQEAIPPLEAADRLQISSLKKGYSPRFGIWRKLGDAYAGVGRNEDARRMLKAALDSAIAQASSKLDDPKVLNARKSWGHFLLTQGEAAEAEAQFREILAQDHGRNLAVTALAHADLAQLALQRGDASAALEASTQSLHIFGNVSGYRTVRIEPILWRIHAQALARTGDINSARDYAQRALDAFTRYDDPSSSNIAESSAVVAEIGKLAKK